MDNEVLKLTLSSEQYKYLENRRKELGFDTVAAYLRYMIDAARLNRKPY